MAIDGNDQTIMPLRPCSRQYKPHTVCRPTPMWCRMWACPYPCATRPRARTRLTRPRVRTGLIRLRVRTSLPRPRVVPSPKQTGLVFLRMGCGAQTPPSVLACVHVHRYMYRHVYRLVYGHVYRHVCRLVYRHVYIHVHRHVCRHVYTCVQTCVYT